MVAVKGHGHAFDRVCGTPSTHRVCHRTRSKGTDRRIHIPYAAAKPKRVDRNRIMDDLCCLIIVRCPVVCFWKEEGAKNPPPSFRCSLVRYGSYPWMIILYRVNVLVRHCYRYVIQFFVLSRQRRPTNIPLLFYFSHRTPPVGLAALAPNKKLHMTPTNGVLPFPFCWSTTWNWSKIYTVLAHSSTHGMPVQYLQYCHLHESTTIVPVYWWMPPVAHGLVPVHVHCTVHLNYR